jgi:phosphoglycerate kinase
VKKTIEHVDMADKRVLARVDFNVPLKNKKVVDDTRIRAVLPTIKRMMFKGGRIILCSHLGRPKGERRKELRLDPIAKRLSELLESDVIKTDDCIGQDVSEKVDHLEPGKNLLLENVRFHPEEEKNDPDFAKKLASLADLYVNDAFGTAHRAHASTEGVARNLPSVAGLLMKRELEILAEIIESPQRPFVGLFGGAKIPDKIRAVEHLLEKMDLMLLGGAMANTFLRAKGVEIGRSMVSKESLEVAKRILVGAGERLVLPVDAIVAEGASAGFKYKTVLISKIPSDCQILDVGPTTLRIFREMLRKCRTVVWNGPLGRTELNPFAAGTSDVAHLLADLDAVTVVCGGDTAAAVNRAGLSKKMSHVSTGGGAFLAFLEGKELPGVSVLEDQ